MIKCFRIRHVVAWAVYFIATVLVLGSLLSFVRAQDEPKDKKREQLPDGMTEVTKDHLLTKVPNFFYFEYPFEPQPGKWLWLRITNKHWVERYPDGLESLYKVVGRTSIRKQEGTVVVKVEGDPEKTSTDNEGGFQVFIPDKGTDLAILFRRVGEGDSEWRDMAWSTNKKTIIQKVE